MFEILDAKIKTYQDVDIYFCSGKYIASYYLSDGTKIGLGIGNTVLEALQILENEIRDFDINSR